MSAVPPSVNPLQPGRPGVGSRGGAKPASAAPCRRPNSAAAGGGVNVNRHQRHAGKAPRRWRRFFRAAGGHGPMPRETA